MTNQNQTLPPVHDQGINPGDYGWPQVAEEMHEWHPALQEHALRLITEQGIIPEQRAAESHTLGESAVSHAEVPTHSPESVKSALLGARGIVKRLSTEDEFKRRCRDVEGIDPDDSFEDSRYWVTLASFAKERMQGLRKKGGDELRLSAIELAAATPAFLFAQASLRSERPKEFEHIHNGEIVSKFGGMIRDFATKFPSVRVSDMRLALLNMANDSLESQGMRAVANHELKRELRGVRPEITFEQILAYSKEFNGRPANDEEDRSGFDYIVDGKGSKRGRPMHIDLKASSLQVNDHHTDNGYFARKENGVIVMGPLAHEGEYHDSFFLPPEVAASRADLLDHLLNQARLQTRVA